MKKLLLLLLVTSSCTSTAPEKRCYYARLDVDSMILVESEGRVISATVRCAKQKEERKHEQF